MSFRLSQYLEEKGKAIDEALDAFLPKEDVWPSGLHRAMRYTLFPGGKRFRPILAIASYEAFLPEPPPLLPGLSSILPPACALDLIHTYSLIHDDLPAMDNETLRRGKPPSHKVFGEAGAILAGDALLTEAFRMLLDLSLYPPGTDPLAILAASEEIALAAGSRGMVGGQATDVAVEKVSSSMEDVLLVSKKKTGEMIRVSVRTGARMGGAGDEAMSFLTSYAEKIGLAFQMADDLKDGEGLYLALIGREALEKELKRLVKEGKDHLRPLGENALPLTALADLLLSAS